MHSTNLSGNHNIFIFSSLFLWSSVLFICFATFHDLLHVLMSQFISEIKSERICEKNEKKALYILRF